MKKEKTIEILQNDILIPDIVQQEADFVFEQIKRENGGKVMAYSGTKMRRSMWGAVAAAVLVLGTVVCAAYMHWSRGMEEKFNVTQEQKEFLEDNEIAKPMNNSVTQEGVTVTVQQSIVDNRFAHLSFRVEGYQVREGSTLQPDFENVNVTVDGGDCGMITSGFFNNWHITDDERVYADDGSDIKERNDGSLIERYVNEDGSMEYIISIMTDSKDHGLIGKPIHIELHNLGTFVRYSDAYRKDIDAVWSFDFTLEGSSQVRSLELSQTLGDSGASVAKAEISPISLYVEYSFPMQEIEIDGADQNGSVVKSATFANAPQLTGVRLKDGTLLTNITNGGSEGYEDDNDTYVVYCGTNCVIDPAEVDALLFIKSYPESQEEADNIPEEKLYIVSF